MKPWNKPSLRARLTWRMVGMQILVLIAFVGVAAIPISTLLKDEPALADGIVMEIADGVTRDASGQLVLAEGSAVQNTIAKHPDLWFQVVDGAGGSVGAGTLTSDVAQVVEQIPQLTFASIANVGPPGAENAVVRQLETRAGTVWVIAGGGPGLRIFTVFAAMGNPMFLSLLTVLTLVSFCYIPVLVQRELNGVNRLAAEAHSIDVEQRGIRLSPNYVPIELRSLVRAVNAALQRLDDGMERRQRFLADAAHELRTPIAILQTRMELLPDGPEKARLMLDLARLANLANQLLDLERLDARATNFEPLNLVELAAQVTADMAPMAIAAGDEISFDAEADTVTVSGDAGSLARAVSNLIQNAVIHGGKKAMIRVEVSREGLLRVADSGPGIAEQYRQIIFEPFNRVVPLDQGAGLGLSLVRDIVQRHEGRISVGDAVGGGAMFEIALPLARA